MAFVSCFVFQEIDDKWPFDSLALIDSSSNELLKEY